MTWKTFVSRLAITSRRRGLATAVIYGLSLAVRFTSAAGEEVEIPAQSVQRTHPVTSIMTRDHASLPYQHWGRPPLSHCLSPGLAAEFSDLSGGTAGMPRAIAS